MMIQMTTGFLWVIVHVCEAAFFSLWKLAKDVGVLKFTCPTNTFSDIYLAVWFRCLSSPVSFS